MLSARMDVDLVAVEHEDELTVMLELAAPAQESGVARAPATVQVVLDRSGSMAGERLDAARRALAELAARLDPADRLGVVAFDDDVRVVVPAGPVADRAAVRAAVLAIEPGGTTNLSAGLLRGIQEARRVAGPSGATLLLLSDGHANAGVVDPDRLAGVAAAARAQGVTTSTIGIGLGYDETLLAGLARGGQGSHAFAPDGDGAGAVVAGEVAGLLSKTVQAANLVMRPRAGVQSVTLWNDLPAQPVDGGVMIELGDLWAGERRRLVLTFAVPAMPSLGLAEIATLQLRYVVLPAFAEETVTLPLAVNVVPGDRAAGRVRDPEVTSELLFQRAQDAKRRAADALARGDAPGALDAYRRAGAALRTAAPAAPMAARAELLAEAGILAELADRTAAGDGAWSAKRSRAEHALKARRRGRGM
jgi:Ca-activated chloride channel family protein